MLHDTQESLDITFMDMQDPQSKFKDSLDLHDTACRDLQDAGTRFNEAKRKADDTQDQVQVHRGRCRRLSAVYGTPEENLSEGLGRMGELIRQQKHTRCLALRPYRL